MTHQNNERRRQTDDVAEQAAEAAVRQVFSILGVDVNRPESVEEFRKDLRFGGKMRKAADHGFLVMVGVVVVALAVAMGQGMIAQLLQAAQAVTGK